MTTKSKKGRKKLKKGEKKVMIATYVQEKNKVKGKAIIDEAVKDL